MVGAVFVDRRLFGYFDKCSHYPISGQTSVSNYSDISGSIKQMIMGNDCQSGLNAGSGFIKYSGK